MKKDKSGETIAQEVAKLLLKKSAITLSPKKPYKFASGILSPVYVDCRVLISYPKERRIIRDFYLEAISSSGGKFDLIAGTATAGIPHAAWIAEKLKLPMLYVRGKPKDHGKGSQIEGVIKKGQSAAVIEDLISTGESSKETVRVIRSAGGKALYIFSIITYGMIKAQDNFRSGKIKLISLTNFNTVVNVAYKQKYIKKADKSVILDWAKDPPSWGKRMGFE